MDKVQKPRNSLEFNTLEYAVLIFRGRRSLSGGGKYTLYFNNHGISLAYHAAVRQML
jgi:hypothetical protein